jgi:hypothetical protein
MTDKPVYNNKIPLKVVQQGQKNRRLRETSYEVQDRLFMQAKEDIWKAFELACNEIEQYQIEKTEKTI